MSEFTQTRVSRAGWNLLWLILAVLSVAGCGAQAPDETGDEIAQVILTSSDGCRTIEVPYPEAGLDVENGYWRLLMLGVPPNLKVTDEEFIAELMPVVDPVTASEFELRRIQEKYFKLPDSKNWIKLAQSIKLPEDPRRIVATFKHRTGAMDNFEKDHAWLTRRFQRLLEAGRVEDFSLPMINFPLPDLYKTRSANLAYCWQCVREAKQGNWRLAIGRLLQARRIWVKLIKGSRNPITFMIGLIALEETTLCLMALMDEPACPLGAIEAVRDETAYVEDVGDVALRLMHHEYRLFQHLIDQGVHLTFYPDNFHVAPYDDTIELEALLFDLFWRWADFRTRFPYERDLPCEQFKKKLIQDVVGDVNQETCRAVAWRYFIYRIAFFDLVDAVTFQTVNLYNILKFVATIQCLTRRGIPRKALLEAVRKGPVDPFTGRAITYDQKKKGFFSPSAEDLSNPATSKPKGPGFFAPCRLN